MLLGNANLDINDSEGRPEALAALLSTLQDPLPQSAGGKAYPQNGANSRHKGDPALDTANWPAADGPGNMRVDYVLPAQSLRILDAGVLWPDPQDDFAKTVEAASRHRLVWVNLDWPPTTAPTTELRTEEENGPEGGVKKCRRFPRRPMEEEPAREGRQCHELSPRDGDGLNPDCRAPDRAATVGPKARARKPRAARSRATRARIARLLSNARLGGPVASARICARILGAAP
ncbi:hypothetical protein [Paracoccus cavernae]|uniref:hypothetical protein n=1 Tax=Paracoccus cavernae TaxID=1571207 RepID=UPI003630B749